MFSGIVEKKAPILAISQGNRIEIPNPFPDVILGESIALNGVCLTVAEPPGEKLVFYVSPETFEKTNFRLLKPGHSWVNLERALRAADRLSGHIVQGHADGVGTLLSVEPVEESYRLRIELPESLLRYCILKGSIAVNGVSLTINDVDDLRSTVDLMIIPHTWGVTQLSSLQPGDLVNIEVDVIAKYVERLCNPLKKA